MPEPEDSLGTLRAVLEAMMRQRSRSAAPKQAQEPPRGPEPDLITRAASKITGISRKPPGPGETLLGGGQEGFGSFTDRMAEMLTEGAFSEQPGPIDVLAGAASIPMSKMLRLFKAGGAAEQLLARTPSRILQLEGHPDLAELRSGSRNVAQVASGQAAYDEDPIVDWSRQAVSPRHERILARNELYRITQQLLDRLGISANESVRAYRGGPLYRPGYRLTPTSADEKIAEDYATHVRRPNAFGLQLSPYEVPRQSIRALAGILARGDDITLSEMLIPSRDLIKGKVGDAVVNIEQGGDLLRGAPKRLLRREVARTLEPDLITRAASKIGPSGK